MSSNETSEYSWIQTPDSMVIRVRVGADVKVSDVSVKIESKRVSVLVRGVEVLSGSTENEIRTESVGLLEEDEKESCKFVSLDLLKKTEAWWCRALKSEKPVNISKLPDLKKDDEKPTSPALQPIGKLGEQSTTKEEFKGKSSFVW